MPDGTASPIALAPATRDGAGRLLGAIGVLGIWAFLLVFLLYPLGRIFYDAVTDDHGALTLAHFAAFFTDGYYLRSLWNSVLLGLGVVAGASALGVGIAYLLV